MNSQTSKKWDKFTGIVFNLPPDLIEYNKQNIPEGWEIETILYGGSNTTYWLQLLSPTFETYGSNDYGRPIKSIPLGEHPEELSYETLSDFCQQLILLIKFENFEKSL